MKQRIKCATLITTDNLKMNHACIFSRLNQVGDKISNIKKKISGLVSMRQLSARNQNNTEIQTMGHRTAFNNRQSTYRIVGYKRPRNDNVKQSVKKEN